MKSSFMNQDTMDLKLLKYKENIIANYDYQCEKCEHVQEINHPLEKNPKIKCDQKGCNGKCNRAFWLKAPPFKLNGPFWSSKGRT